MRSAIWVEIERIAFEWNGKRSCNMRCLRIRVSALTFDMRGAQKAQPFGHPLDGRVRHLCGRVRRIDAEIFPCARAYGGIGSQPLEAMCGVDREQPLQWA